MLEEELAFELDELLTELDEDFGTLLELDVSAELQLFAVLEELTVFEELDSSLRELEEFVAISLLELDFGVSLELETTELELLLGFAIYFAIIVIFAVTAISSPATPSFLSPS